MSNRGPVSGSGTLRGGEGDGGGAGRAVRPGAIGRSSPGPLAGSGPLRGGEFDWGGRLPNRNGGARRLAQGGRTSPVECNGISQPDCETDTSSRVERRP